MAVQPLSPATDRRFGGPLPRQLANQTRAHPVPSELFTLYHAVLCAYAVLTVISNCYPPVQGRLPTCYSPVRHYTETVPSENFTVTVPFDLHVLGTPPAFILSQDQTLIKRFYPRIPRFSIAGINLLSRDYCCLVRILIAYISEILLKESSGFCILFSLQLSRSVFAPLCEARHL